MPAFCFAAWRSKQTSQRETGRPRNSRFTGGRDKHSTHTPRAFAVARRSAMVSPAAFWQRRHFIDPRRGGFDRHVIQRSRWPRFTISRTAWTRSVDSGFCSGCRFFAISGFPMPQALRGIPSTSSYSPKLFEVHRQTCKPPGAS